MFTNAICVWRHYQNHKLRFVALAAHIQELSPTEDVSKTEMHDPTTARAAYHTPRSGTPGLCLTWAYPETSATLLRIA